MRDEILDADAVKAGGIAPHLGNILIDPRPRGGNDFVTATLKVAFELLPTRRCHPLAMDEDDGFGCTHIFPDRFLRGFCSSIRTGTKPPQTARAPKPPSTQDGF